MANQTKRILIESILGGQSDFAYFSAANQFRASFGIDPTLAILPPALSSNVSVQASGLLRPVGCTSIGTTVAAPLWIKENPKDSNHYVYDSTGSAYSLTTSALTPLSDGGALSNSTGNGCEYYDNYIYFAKSTDIARYGPLNGAPAFNGSYWVTTLGKTALSNTTYPTMTLLNVNFPNHVMHRHSDGKLYFTDVVGNQGYLHVISTTKTSVEGDTDAGSTYLKLAFGYGIWPTVIESYGSSLVIGCIEKSATGSGMQAKIAFWDTTSQNFNSITWVEFSDPYIGTIKNIGGVLYVTSANAFTTTGDPSGFRISRYIGGNTFKEVFLHESGYIYHPGSVGGDSDRLLIGGKTVSPDIAACVHSLGLQKSILTDKFFTPYTVTSSDNAVISAVTIPFAGSGTGHNTPFIGYSNTTDSAYGIERPDQNTDFTANSNWWSQVFKISQPFKITKVKIPLAQPLSTSMGNVVAKFYIDDGRGSKTLSTISSAVFGTTRQIIVIRPENLTGDSNFWLELVWSGSGLTTPLVIGLPITIEYELLDVDTTYQ